MNAAEKKKWRASNPQLNVTRVNVTHLFSQVQKYQLESGSEQEIQLLVTGDNISLTQEIGTVTPQMQMPGALDTQAGPPRTESMYVITLSKEAAEHLHVAHGPAQ